MVLKITEELSDRVNRIVRHSCCNCIDDNCLLLDGGVQAYRAERGQHLFSDLCKKNPHK